MIVPLPIITRPKSVLKRRRSPSVILTSDPNPSSEGNNDTVPNSEGYNDTDSANVPLPTITRPKSISKRRRCPSVILTSDPNPSSEGNNDTVPNSEGYNDTDSANVTPLKKQRMFNEYTVGLDGSPTKLIKTEPITSFPSIKDPILISSSPEPSPEKEPRIEPTLVTINDNGEGGDTLREVNFRDQVEQFVFTVDSISKCTNGQRSSLPSTEVRLRSVEKKIQAAKTAERKQFHENSKQRLLARAQKVKDLLAEDQKSKATLSKPQQPVIDYEHRQRIKEEEILKWRYQDHMINYMGRWVKCSYRDRECEAPPDPKTTEVRECNYCMLNIDLSKWHAHIQSRYHLVSFQSNLWLKSFCWYKNKEIPWHRWMGCKECHRRIEKNGR